MFNTKFPIVAVGMNQVSDLNLALAVAKAGAIPTISGFNYYETEYSLNLDKIENDFQMFLYDQKNCNFMFGIDDCHLIHNKDIIDLLIKYKVFGIELITSFDIFKEKFLEINSLIKKIKRNGIKIIWKNFGEFTDSDRLWNHYINNNFDALLIKGNLGAGRVSNINNKSLLELTKETKQRFNNKCLISSGGIGTALEVKNLIDSGANAIGIGTLFAASKESCLSAEAKRKLIDSQFTDVERLNTYDFDQHALIFSSVVQNKTNNTKGLSIGISTGKEGHIFVGKGINNITEIKSVKEIVEDLCKLL